MPRLGLDEIDRRLRDLPAWRREGDAIVRQFTFDSFPEAVAFVNRLVPATEAADHHPDITVTYKRVTLIYSTHSEGGITEKDFAGAKDADARAAPAEPRAN